ncbi:MAG: serine hydrolase [Candidatus Uhrbacteria bacterium]|nr:serine hydrolase [Candidatus Uhrbacteria bacterium]
MILKFFTQIILASTLLQLFPVDVSDVQRLATHPSEQAPSLYNFFTLPNAHLPQSADAAPTKIHPNSLGVVTSAESAIVVDRKTKQILFQKNIDTPRSIGSITKLMTAFVFLSTNPDLNAPAKLQAEDFRAGGVQHVGFGDDATVKDILYASLISSDNSATASLARLSGMSIQDFVVKMNKTAISMGMERTHFEDPTGLSPRNESVVSDLVKMLDVVAQNDIIRDATEHDTFAITTVSGKTYNLKSTDQLLSSFVNQQPYRIVAGKTGYLPEAGYCLGTVLNHDGAGDIIVVVLGSETNADRFQDIKSLAVWSYQTFKWPGQLSYVAKTHGADPLFTE